MQIADIISNCRFLSAVDARGRARLVSMATHHVYERGEMIFRQDDPCPGIFIVGTGQVRVFKVGASGKEHVLHLVGPGTTFAEVAAIGGFACPAYAEALEPTECALLPADGFNRALREDHQLCLQIVGGMASWVRQLVGLLEDIVLRDATSRVASFLLQTTGGSGGDVALPSLKKHLANHLNLTSETLSRSLRRLEDDGLIERTCGGLRIVDPESLAQLSGGNYPRI